MAADVAGPKTRTVGGRIGDPTRDSVGEPVPVGFQRNAPISPVIG